MDTGLYASSWNVKKDDKKTISFGNSAPYAVHVEYGSEPFNAPITPLLEWAGRKLQKPITDPEVKNMAWGVKSKIAKEGITPQHVMEKGIDDILLRNIKSEIDREVRSTLQTNNKGNL